MTAELTVEQRYLDLMKRCLTRYDLEEEQRYQPVVVRSSGLKGRVRLMIQAAFRRRNLELVRPREPANLDDREVGRDRPASAETMVGLRRLDNIQACLEDILKNDVPGDLIETGVWRGGSCIFMRAVLAAHGVTDRRVWVADSFQGLPKPDDLRYPSDAGDEHWLATELAVSLEQVKTNFRRYGLLDERIRFLEGWFKDTLPGAPIERLSLLRLDGDLYESTIQALDALYPKLSVGGYVIVDDYYAVPACRDAVNDFRRGHGIVDEIVEIDWTGVYWRRSGTVL